MLIENLYTTEDHNQVNAAIEQLIADCSSFSNDDDLAKIKHAFEFALDAHKFVRRKSGEPYILHPIAVASIVANEIGLQDRTSIIAALLHDVVEDTQFSLKDIEHEFGASVAKIVDGLTKISTIIDPTSSKQADSFRKMLLTMSDDIRVALIKIADRLHNMRTMEHMKRDKQLKISSETVYLYAPLAHRLGLFSIKSELDDYAFKYMEPEEYSSIFQKLTDTKEERDTYIQRFIQPIKDKLNEKGIDCAITGRVKGVYSIYQKMKKQNIPLEEVYDLFAIRIIPQTDVNDPNDKLVCWDVYNTLTSLYTTHSKRLRDWISSPKANGYEALHTTVSHEGRWVEIQIRSKRMDLDAEKGIAAHWKYKEGNVQVDERFEMWITKTRELLENKSLTGMDFVNEVKTSLIAEQIHVFTPKGDLKIMPIGSTALDFAYEIHSELGNKIIGAKVNYKVVPINYVLQNGDRVEIITSDKQKPEEKWLQYAKTHKAITRIQEAIKVKKKEFEEKGRKIFLWKLKNLNIDESHIFVKELLKKFDIEDINEFYFKLGSKRIDLQKIQAFVHEKQNLIYELQSYSTIMNHSAMTHAFNEMIQRTRGIDADSLVLDNTIKKTAHVYASCCNPIHGDEIVGFVDKNQITIHRTSCSTAIELMTYDGSKIIKAKWNENQYVEFLCGVKIAGQDRMGMLNDLVKVITLSSKVNIRSITIDTFDNFYEGIIKLYVHNTHELEKLIAQIRKVEGVFTVERTNS